VAKLGRTLDKYSVQGILEGHPPRTNFNVAAIDGEYTIRIATVEGTFPPHHHDGDEAWYIQSGGLRIDSELGAVELRSGEGTVVPAGTRHSPTCLEEGTTVVIVHRKNFATIPVDETEFAESGYREYDGVAIEGAK
jgi:mannose-6-phosphate isomerase-like protein (cupin superfamily)